MRKFGLDKSTTQRGVGVWMLVCVALAVEVPTVSGQDDDLDSLISQDTPAGPSEAESLPATQRTDPSESQRPSAETKGPKPSERSSRRIIEEIIVTAQKREESLLDVPISLSVLDAEFLKEHSITDFRDVYLHVPNLVIDNSGNNEDVRIRGFGSAMSNKAFEESVGLVIDGIPYGRNVYFLGALFDIERVEVLRGPQGTLFGKNTTAGLINLIPKKPTDEYTGSLDVQLGELDRRRFEAAVGGPVIAGLANFRIAGLSDERRGFIENTTAAVQETANPFMSGRDRKGVRAQLDFPNLLGTALRLSYEKVEIDLTYGGWEFRTVNPDVIPFFRDWDPNVDIEPGNFIGSISHAGFVSQELDTFVANAGYGIGGWRLDAVAGHSLLQVNLRNSDADFTPAPIFWAHSRDENPQTTAELRLSSPALPGLLGLDQPFGISLGGTDLTLGFFYQRRRIDDSALPILLNTPVLAEFVAAQNTPSGQLPLEVLHDVFAQGSLGLDETTGFFEQTSNSFAGFGQMNWAFLEPWSLQYGMRLTHETKDADISRVCTQGTCAAFVALGLKDFETSLSRSEFAFTPKVALQYDWTDDLTFFASWAKGFKSGGFNEQASNADDVTNIIFDPERTTAYEVGSKTELLGGAARVNLGLFWQDATDLQVYTVQPMTAVVSVTNAGKARARGAEVDATWLPVDWLTILGTLAFNDSEFLEFPFGTCTGDRPDTDGDGDPRCDLSGQPLFRTPKWTSTLTGQVRLPLARVSPVSDLTPAFLGGIDLLGALMVEYRDTHFTDRSLDPRARQPSFFRLAGNLGFGNPAQGWSLAIHAENLTNETITRQIQEVTLGGGNFSQMPEAPRQIFGTFRWEF